MSFFPKASLAFVIVTPVFLFITVLAAGGGYGSYMPAKILFPWTMAATAFTNGITGPLMAMAIMQYPLYGIMLDWARSAARLRLGMLAIAGVHFVAVAVAFLISDRSFTP
jgi:hypothetical protein